MARSLEHDDQAAGVELRLGPDGDLVIFILTSLLPSVTRLRAHFMLFMKM